MSDRTVPERVNEFLIRRQGRAYCDFCIQERLGLRWRQQVQLVTATLAVTESFRRESSTCCTCHQQKQVILFANPKPSVPAASGFKEKIPVLQPGYHRSQAVLAKPRNSIG